MNNRKGADDILLSLAAKAESATSLPELIPIHKAVFGILETVDCPLQRVHLGPDEYGMFRSDSIPELNQDNCYLGNICGLYTRQDDTCIFITIREIAIAKRKVPQMGI